MDFSSSVKRRNRRIKTEGGEYGRRLQLYLYPPMSDITLEEFEDVATARQKSEGVTHWGHGNHGNKGYCSRPQCLER